jgi:hypothetical protein
MYYTICHTQPLDTWPYLLLACFDPYIHKLRMERHNNTIWELCELFLTNKTSGCLTLINARGQNNKSQDNIVPSWLLPCACTTKLLKCNIRAKSNIILVLHHPHNKAPLTTNTRNNNPICIIYML